MRLRIPYETFADGYGGSYSTVLPWVRLGTPHERLPLTRQFQAVVDSGASRCMFNAAMLRPLGLQLEAGRRELTTGISGDQLVWVHPVKLFVGGSPMLIEAAFQEDLPVAGLLGMEGFFEHFIVTFDSLARECQLDRIYRA